MTIFTKKNHCKLIVYSGFCQLFRAIESVKLPMGEYQPEGDYPEGFEIRTSVPTKAKAL